MGKAFALEIKCVALVARADSVLICFDSHPIVFIASALEQESESCVRPVSSILAWIRKGVAFGAGQHCVCGRGVSPKGTAVNARRIVFRALIWRGEKAEIGSKLDFWTGKRPGKRVKMPENASFLTAANLRRSVFEGAFLEQNGPENLLLGPPRASFWIHVLKKTQRPGRVNFDVRLERVARVNFPT